MIRLPEHVRRRWLRLALFALFACASLLLAGWLLFEAKNKAAQELVGVVSMLAGLWAFAGTVAQLLPPPPPPPDPAEAADQLAATVREQWSEEVGARQLRDPAVIPLSWAATDRPVAAPAESVVGPQAGRITRLSLDGRLEGDFDRAASQLAAGFRQVPSGRLVVLGEPGAGKTVLALMLTLGLLTDRASRQPVPVLLSVSSWDPVSESLDDWIVGSLATSYYGGRTQIPRLLLDRRKLLPVLDGLDEIPEAARRNAVRGLNEACGEGRGVVVTCRSAEYQDVIEGGSPPLRKAPVVEVAPVSVPDAIAYLTEVNWPDGVDWEPVYTHLRQHPDGPAATALSTPLALSLARGVYRHCDRDPGELLGYDSSHAIEDHLVDHIIPAAYAPPPGTLPQQTDGDWQEVAQKAERWLTFLATYLHQHRERDLAWWLMSPRLLSRWSGLLVGIGLSLVAMLVVLAVREAFGESGLSSDTMWIGVAVAVLAMLTWYAAPDQPPSRVSFALRGTLHRLRGGFRTGFTLAALLAVTVLGIVGAVNTLGGGWSTEARAVSYEVVAAAAGAATAIGLAFAVHGWLNTPPEHSSRTSPKGLIRQDRTSSLAAAGFAGVVLGVTWLPLAVLGIAVARTALLASTNLRGMPSIADALVGSANSGSPAFSFSEPTEILAATVLPGVVFTVLMLLPRAWPRFVLLRSVLAGQGRLPWRFVQFLDDARERQLLRQSGGLYQFRHIRLQERLASRSLARNRASTPSPGAVRRRRWQIVGTAAVLTAGAIFGNQLMLPEDESHIVLPTGEVEDIAFGPSGEHSLVTLNSEGTVHRWNTETGARVTVGQVPGGDELRYSLGGRKTGALLVASDGAKIRKMVEVPWSGPRDGEHPELPARARSWTYSGVMSTGGRLLMIKPSGAQVLLDVEGDDGEDIPTRGSSWYRGAVQAVDGAVADDGAALVRTGAYLERIRVFDPDQHWCNLDITGRAAVGVGSTAIDAHGKRFATVQGTTVALWDARCRKSQEIRAYSKVRGVALNADGTELAVTDGQGFTRLYEDLP